MATAPDLSQIPPLVNPVLGLGMPEWKDGELCYVFDLSRPLPKTMEVLFPVSTNPERLPEGTMLGEFSQTRPPNRPTYKQAMSKMGRSMDLADIEGIEFQRLLRFAHAEGRLPKFLQDIGALDSEGRLNPLSRV